MSNCFLPIQITQFTTAMEHKMPSIQEAIDRYMSVFRNNFPHSILPKHHILECHCIPFIEHLPFWSGTSGRAGYRTHPLHSSKDREKNTGNQEWHRKHSSSHEHQPLTDSPTTTCVGTHKKKKTWHPTQAAHNRITSLIFSLVKILYMAYTYIIYLNSNITKSILRLFLPRLL